MDIAGTFQEREREREGEGEGVLLSGGDGVIVCVMAKIPWLWSQVKVFYLEQFVIKIKQHTLSSHTHTLAYTHSLTHSHLHSYTHTLTHSLTLTHSFSLTGKVVSHPLL